MGSKHIVLVSTAGFSVLNTGILWREAKTKGFFRSVGMGEERCLCMDNYTLIQYNKVERSGGYGM